MNCLTCNKDTNNPKYCSRTCAARMNNTLYPKRKPEHVCKTCGEYINSKKWYCSQKCKPINANEGTKPYIRAHARKVYDGPLKCAICHYDKHVDICHIRDVRYFSFPYDYSEVNARSNLIALCKNHHWEFDHYFL